MQTIAPTILIPAARRFANQLNENSNVFARPSELPEMNHNEIVAWSSANENEHSIIYFSCENIHSRVHSGMNWMLENIDNDSSWIIDCEGGSLLERINGEAGILSRFLRLLPSCLVNSHSRAAPPYPS